MVGGWVAKTMVNRGRIQAVALIIIVCLGLIPSSHTLAQSYTYTAVFDFSGGTLPSGTYLGGVPCPSVLDSTGLISMGYGYRSSQCVGVGFYLPVSGTITQINTEFDINPTSAGIPLYVLAEYPSWGNWMLQCNPLPASGNCGPLGVVTSSSSQYALWYPSNWWEPNRYHVTRIEVTYTTTTPYETPTPTPPPSTPTPTFGLDGLFGTTSPIYGWPCTPTPDDRTPTVRPTSTRPPLVSSTPRNTSTPFPTRTPIASTTPTPTPFESTATPYPTEFPTASPTATTTPYPCRPAGDYTTPVVDIGFETTCGTCYTILPPIHINTPALVVFSTTLFPAVNVNFDGVEICTKYQQFTGSMFGFSLNDFFILMGLLFWLATIQNFIGFSL